MLRNGNKATKQKTLTGLIIGSGWENAKGKIGNAKYETGTKSKKKHTVIGLIDVFSKLSNIFDWLQAKKIKLKYNDNEDKMYDINITQTKAKPNQSKTKDD